MDQSQTQSQNAPYKGRAIAAESLYLLNLLFPIIPLAFLTVIYFRNRTTSSEYLRSHVLQPWIAALISTTLFILINLVAWLMGGYSSMDNLVSIHSLVALEAYTLLVILPFLVPGLFALTKAMSGLAWRYPLIGRLL
ncbi:hypothetical protein [Thiolapillus brandeum]|uniref:DUF4870 domain-containing protein n=1 Tax=Thiolapillus brandeum TaxID=1076588 RepID=A0A7U6GK01_9GAMM|nr:hypothetical protein [Thiolapillus brandeum]BAO45062.1 conserved hypothetical protein [Thiolapillus brandeum]